MRNTILAICLLFAAIIGYSAVIEPVHNVSMADASISRQEARWIYTLKTRFWHDGQRITIYILPLSSEVHQKFVREVLELQPAAYIKAIQANINSGVSPSIKEVKNLEEMLLQIETRPGAVGYLSNDFLIVNGFGHVNVLKIID